MGASPEESADGLWTHESFVYNTDKMEEFRVWGPGPSKARFFMERPLMDVLQMLLRREGTTLAEDPRRLGNLLRDWCPGQRREIGLVTVVAEEGLPALLRSETMPPTTRRSLALRRLREERGLDAAAAARGVDLWIGALGEASQASEGRAEFPEEVEDPPPAKSSLEERARNLDREAWQRACHAPLFSGNTPEEAMDRARGALYSSEGPEGSPEEVAPLLEEAALLGNREALHWLAELQDVTGYAPRDAGAVCEERRRRAERDADEAFRLGWTLLHRACPSAAPEGRRMLRRAAEQGHPGAWGELGLCLEQGLGGARHFGQAAEAYRRSAEGGDPAAAYALGLMYRAGLGVLRDDREGARWILQASEAGWAEARSTLGALYASGAGVPRDFSRATASYREAQHLPLLTEEELFLRRSREFQRRQLDQEHPGALRIWGERFALGWEGAVDRARALACLDRLTDNPEARATAQRLRGEATREPEHPEEEARALADLPSSAPIRWRRALLRRYQEERGLLRDATEALARNGDPEALALEGYLALTGRCGRERDPIAGRLRLRLAALGGQEDALAWVGSRYFGQVSAEDGAPMDAAGAPEDRPLALRWLLRQARRGEAEAQRRLGILLLEDAQGGSGASAPSPLEEEGLRWLEKAAAQGDGEASFSLGAHWDRQGAAPEHRAEAERWYQVAASREHPEALYRLALRSLYGKPRDLARALDFYRRAADRGHVVAQNNLGAMYACGFGVPRDLPRALQWFRQAAAMGHEGARRNAEKLALEMGWEPEDRNLWQRFREWIGPRSRS